MDSGDFILYIAKQKLFLLHQPILLAVSGGIDSMVMVDLFHHSKIPFAIAHCNFGLRGRESDEDASFVKDHAKKLHVPFFTKNFNTEDVSLQKGISIQMAARELRYEWFDQIRSENGYEYIATAHHLDDQAETFLINLLRGTGIAGLHGIPVKKGRVVRPMLFTYRSEIKQYATEHHIFYREDHSNIETKYLRNKIRHDLIPLISSINPEFTKGLSETIQRISEFEQIGSFALEEWRARMLLKEEGDYVIGIEPLLKTTPIETFAWELFSPFGFNETQVKNVLDCLSKEGKKVFLSPTHRLVKDRKRLVISVIETKHHNKITKIDNFSCRKNIKVPVPLVFTRLHKLDNYEIPATGKIATLDYEKLQFPLMVRRWQPGDTFFPLGMRKRKKLSDFFIDQKFSIKQKEGTWLLCSGKNIVWIIGHRIDHRFRITSATRELICITMQND
jgi:tRNA(Ile)-lysidine synthase